MREEEREKNGETVKMQNEQQTRNVNLMNENNVKTQRTYSIVQASAPTQY